MACTLPYGDLQGSDAVREQEVSDQKVCLSRAGDATDGDGTDGTLEVAWISVSSQPGDLLLLLFF